MIHSDRSSHEIFSICAVDHCFDIFVLYGDESKTPRLAVVIQRNEYVIHLSELLDILGKMLFCTCIREIANVQFLGSFNCFKLGYEVRSDFI